jgi:hypothetical protein
MDIILTVRGKRFECRTTQLAKKLKALSLETTGLTRIIARLKQAAIAGQSGRINSADGYQVSYHFKRKDCE